MEELLRFTNPVQVSSPRYVVEDVEIAGVPIRRGESVYPLLGSANRDETKFTAPAGLDLGRTPI